MKSSTKRTNSKPEVLAPAGSLEALQAAVSGGCDAVYLGGARFGARAYADNFDRDSMVEAIDYAHLHGVKAYCTMNTLLKEGELEEGLAEADFLYRNGIDAIILQDFGFFYLLRKHFPDLPLHASTQMTIHSLEGAEFLERAGCSRVVLSRELSLEEIRGIAGRTSLETEVFVHGALCYCYSGQCLMSSMIGGRSGNRGRCAQPCRLPYSTGEGNPPSHLLSPKDIATLELVPALVEAGVDSLKIEGRMKNDIYVALATRAYRRAVEGKTGPQDLEELMQIFNRGGFSQGYLQTENGQEMMATNWPSHQGVLVGQLLGKGKGRHDYDAVLYKDVQQGDALAYTGAAGEKESFTADKFHPAGKTSLWITQKPAGFPKDLCRLKSVALEEQVRRSVLEERRKLPVAARIQALPGQNLALRLAWNRVEVAVEGGPVQAPTGAPTTREQLLKAFDRTGDVDFNFTEVDLELGEVFLPVGAVKKLRRDGLEQLSKAILEADRRGSGLPEVQAAEVHWKAGSLQTAGDLLPSYQFLCRSREQVQGLLEAYAALERPSWRMALFLPWDLFPKDTWRSHKEAAEAAGVGLCLSLPRITRRKVLAAVAKDLQDHPDIFAGVLLRSPDGYGPMAELGYPLHLDYSMNIMNSQSCHFWDSQSRGYATFTPSQELSRVEAEALPLEKRVQYLYGKLELMVTAQCVHKTETGRCLKGEKGIAAWGISRLLDRKGNSLPVLRSCKVCLNTLFDARPFFLLEQAGDFKGKGIRFFRLDLLDETQEQAKTLCGLVQSLETGDALSTDTALARLGIQAVTRGHDRKGVE
ncbi:peptidase U32 family protein [Anaerotalea alkaliphila]|uniref:U32 family peptidase n=1 Tax=Anaerotalea alkaliphila TaxID=2662126 RepID=A0A7X5HXF0_9FIRM|nr:U32 family peptidase [Anaerotalea alkaliphila]NDL68442.1 U32 family peptidase [Anaerotalea alkaliphila]